AGQVDEAVDALRVAVALDPGHARALEALERAEAAATPAPDTLILFPRGARPRSAEEREGQPEPAARETRLIPPPPPPPPPSPAPAPAPPPAPAAAAPLPEEPWRPCPECQARNAATARVCWECGAFLRPAIIETCPYCTAALHKVKRGSVEA